MASSQNAYTVYNSKITGLNSISNLQMYVITVVPIRVPTTGIQELTDIHNVGIVASNLIYTKEKKKVVKKPYYKNVTGKKNRWACG